MPSVDFCSSKRMLLFFVFRLLNAQFFETSTVGNLSNYEDSSRLAKLKEDEVKVRAIFGKAVDNKDLISACYEAARAYQIVDGDLGTVEANNSDIFVNGNASFSADSSLEPYFQVDFFSNGDSFEEEYFNETLYVEREVDEDLLDRSNYVFSEDFIYCNILNRQIKKSDDTVR